MDHQFGTHTQKRDHAGEGKVGSRRSTVDDPRLPCPAVLGGAEKVQVTAHG